MKTNSNLINFDNTWIDASKPTISISQVLTLIQEPFDSQAVAEKTFNKRFNDPESEYYQKTVEQILEMWESKAAKSRDYGSKLDDYIGINLKGTEDDLEMYKLDNDFDNDERLKAITESYDNFITAASNNEGLEFVDREQTLFYDMGDFYVKGRVDAIFANSAENKIYVIDWKSSDKIELKPTQWTKKLLGPAKCYDALNYITYSIQTFFYKTALLNHYLSDNYGEADVDVKIVNLPGHIIDDKNYAVYDAGIKYDKSVLDSIFTFAYKKNILMNKKNV